MRCFLVYLLLGHPPAEWPRLVRLSICLGAVAGKIMNAFGILLLCGLFDYGSPIMCYECNSAINSMCAEGALSAVLKRNCSEHDRGVTHTLCRKIIQHVDYGVNGRLPESRTIRSCGWDESKYKGKCYTRAGYGGRQEVCSCTTDYCNGAHHHTGGGIMAATILMFTATKIF